MGQEDLASCLGYVNESNNFRLSEDMVEVNYLRSFMGLDSASAVIQHIEWSKSSFFRKERLEVALEILSKNCLSGEY